MSDCSRFEDLPKFIDGECSDKMVAAEQYQLLKAAGKDTSIAHEWTGIALSGGGIRSASFCLGALQAMAHLNLLHEFNYISTVSGGGYIGSSLQWFWQKDAMTGTGPSDFPYGTNAPGTVESPVDGIAAQRLSYLRNHGNYLIPGRGLTYASMGMVLLRTMLANLATWISVFAAGFFVLQLLGFSFSGAPDSFKNILSKFSFLVAVNNTQCECLAGRVPVLFVYCVLISLLLIAALVVVSIIYIVTCRLAVQSGSYFRTMFIVLITTLLTTAVYFITSFEKTDWVSLLMFALPASVGTWIVWRQLCVLLTQKYPNFLYAWSWSLDRWSGRIAGCAVLLFVFGTIPSVYLTLIDLYSAAKPQTAAFSWKLLGILVALAPPIAAVGTGLYGFYFSLNKILGHRTLAVVAVLGAVLVLYTVMLAAYVFSVLVLDPQGFHNLTGIDLIGSTWVNGILDFKRTIYIFATIAVFTIVSAWLINVNLVGLHRFYRDRLMETFLPDGISKTRYAVRRSDEANRFSVRGLFPNIDSKKGSETALRPFPIINTNIILLGDENKKYATRGGDSFSITPLYSGSRSTGWESMESHEMKNGFTSLATAMAASGAAANSNSGYLGTGLTMNRVVSLVMMLLNIRLGVWFARPSASPGLAKWVWRQPSHFLPGLWTAVFGHKSTRRFIELSDGGHFDNLGIYELIRRKAKLIVVIDSEADPEFAFRSLASVVQRVAEDFRVKIKFEPGRGPERVLTMIPLKYPKSTSCSGTSFFVGRIEYPNDDSCGVIIYIKSSIMERLSLSTLSYRAQFADFPHQTTLDQFFNPVQFEAYRELGYLCLEEALGSSGLNLRASFEGSQREASKKRHSRIARQIRLTENVLAKYEAAESMK